MHLRCRRWLDKLSLTTPSNRKAGRQRRQIQPKHQEIVCILQTLQKKDEQIISKLVRRQTRWHCLVQQPVSFNRSFVMRRTITLLSCTQI